MLDVLVPHPGLDRTRIVSDTRRGITASVAEHMRVDRECHSGTLTEARNFASVVTAAAT